MGDLKRNSRFASRIASLSAFTFSSIQVFVITTYPFLAEKFGLSLSSIVACFALGSLLFVVGAPMWAGISDRLGRMPVLAIGTGALATSTGLIALCALLNDLSSLTAFAALLFSRVIYGLVASSIPSVAQSLQSDAASEDGVEPTRLQNRAMLIHSLSLNTGRVAGIAAFLFLNVGIPTMLVGFTTAIALVFMLTFSLSLRADIKAGSSHAQPAQVAASSRTALRPELKTEMKWVFALALLFTCFLEALNSSLAGTLQSNFNWDPQTVARYTALLLLASGLLIVALQLVRTRLVHSFAINPMAAGLSSLAIGSVAFTLADTESLLWASFFFFSIGAALIPPYYLSLIRNRTDATAYGRSAGLIGSAQTLGYAVGAGVAAFVFKFESLKPGVVLLAITLIMTVIWLRQVSLIPVGEHAREL